MVVVTQSSVHHEVTVSPLGSGDAQHSVLPPVNVKDVEQGAWRTAEPPKETETPVMAWDISGHPPKSTEVVKPAIQQEVPPQPPEDTESSPSQQETQLSLLQGLALQLCSRPCCSAAP